MNSIIDSCFEGCHKNCFRKFKYKCIYDIKPTKITIFEIIDLTITGENTKLYDVNKKLKKARRNDFMNNQVKKLTAKIYSHQRYIDICFYLKVQIPMHLRQFFRVISQSPENVGNFGNNLNYFFHSAYQKWFSQLK